MWWTSALGLIGVRIRTCCSRALPEREEQSQLASWLTVETHSQAVRLWVATQEVDIRLSGLGSSEWTDLAASRFHGGEAHFRVCLRVLEAIQGRRPRFR